jgi:hypothetical protein
VLCGLRHQEWGHRIYLEDQRAIAVEQNVSFKRQEGPVLDPGSVQIKGERRSGSDNDQHTDLKDQVATDVSQAPASLVTPKPHVTPETLNLAPRKARNTPDRLGLNFEQPAPVQNIRCST